MLFNQTFFSIFSQHIINFLQLPAIIMNSFVYMAKTSISDLWNWNNKLKSTLNSGQPNMSTISLKLIQAGGACINPFMETPSSWRNLWPLCSDAYNPVTFMQMLMHSAFAYGRKINEYWQDFTKPLLTELSHNAEYPWVIGANCTFVLLIINILSISNEYPVNNGLVQSLICRREFVLILSIHY